MGQTFGKADLPKEFANFYNLPKNCVYELWEAFNDVAEGFGLSPIEFQEIVRVSIKDYTCLTEERIDDLSLKFFYVFDTDENELVDSLEMLSAFAILSGMELEDKVRYIFGIYDFDESGLLTLDECILAMRATIGGLCKIAGISHPLENDIENIAVSAFPTDENVPEGSMGEDGAGTINRDNFILFARRTSEIMSWLDYFGDIEDTTSTEMNLEGMVSKRIVYRDLPPKRDITNTAANNHDDGLLYRLDIEKSTPKMEVTPLPQWRQAAAFTEPGGTESDPNIPNMYIKLKSVFGHNTHVRGAIHYTKGRGIVYSSGAVGVCFDIETGEQRYCIEHNDTISCLRLYEKESGKVLIASGEVGLEPRIVIWDTDTMDSLAILRGFHKNRIASCDFSPNGKRLASVGDDKYHSVAIWDWTKNSLLYTAQSTINPVNDLRYVSKNRFVTCGVNHLHLWTSEERTLRRSRGIFGRKTQRQAILCVLALGDVIVSGTITGNFLIWDGRSCVRTVKAHSCAITAMYLAKKPGNKGPMTLNINEDGSVSTSNAPADPSTSTNGLETKVPEGSGFITCTEDGKISLWNMNLELGHSFDIKGLGAIDNSLQSVSWDPSNQRIILGTLSGEIFEISDVDGTNLHRGPIAIGHGLPGGLHGLAVHPQHESVAVTVGEDRTVRLWNIHQNKMIKMVVLDTPAHTVAFAPSGESIAVGLGLDLEDGSIRKDGGFVIIDCNSLTVLHEGRDSKKCVGSIKFSPDGKVMALGSFDGTIYFYMTTDFGCKAKCRGHRGKILNLDFSSDGVYLQSVCSEGMLLFWDVDMCEERAPKNMKGIEWFTQDCQYSWQLKNAWGSFSKDGVKIVSSSKTQIGNIIATADDFGRLQVWRNPVISSEQPAAVDIRGAGAPCSNVAFSCKDDTLLVTSRDSANLFVYKVEIEPLQLIEKEEEIRVPDAVPGDLKDHTYFDVPAPVTACNEGDSKAICMMEEEGADTDFAPMMPWQKMIVAPTKAPEEDNEDPDSNINLEWVHGYRCFDTRGAIIYCKGAKDTDILFFSGSVAVVMRPKAGNQSIQRFYLEHNDEILCSATHSYRPYVATGQRGDRPQVHVWNPDTLETYAIFKNFHRKAVTQVKFSPNGRYLVTVGCSDYHTIAVYHWESRTLVGQTQYHTVKPLAIDFTLDNHGLISCGKHHIRFWSFEGRNITFRNAQIDPGVRENFSMKQTFYAVGWAGTLGIIATSTGQLWRFEGCQVDGAVKGHTGPIYTMHTTNEGIITGGHDGYVRVWSLALQVRYTIDMSIRGAQNPIVRSVYWDNEAFKLLIGTLGNEIFELHSNDGSNLHGNAPIIQGHAGDALTAVAAHPSEDEYVTVGEDKLLKVWNIRNRRCKRIEQLELPARTVTYNPDGDLLAVGFGSPTGGGQKGRVFDGKWCILHAKSFDILHEARDTTKYITEMKWSPNGTLLAVGSFDNKLYVYSCDNHYALAAVVQQHNAPIRHVDFSANSIYMQVNCGGYQLAYYEADTGLSIPSASRLKDVVWSSQTATMSWFTQGLWPAENSGNEILCCDTNFANEHGDKVIAAGDNFGRVRLVRYPCQSSYCLGKQYSVHSGPVSSVRWVGGDSHLVSTSHKDRSIFQWKHVVDDINVKTDEDGEVEEIKSGGTAAIMTTGGEDDDAELFDTEELMKELVTLEQSIAPPEEGMSNKNRPWMATIVPPTDDRPGLEGGPDVKLELEWVHGYNSQQTHCSLGFTMEDNVVYPAAGTCVIFNRKNNSQQHYRGHEREITAVTVAPNQKYAASADRSRRPRIHIWDCQTNQALRILPPYHRIGVCCLSFNSSGKRLVSVGSDMDHSIAVWQSPSSQWHDGNLLAYQKADLGSVYFAAFTPVSDSIYNVVTGGVDHVKFWELRGRNLCAIRGNCGNIGVMQTMLCGAAIGERVATGAVSGHMYVWNGRDLEKVIRAHDRAVTAISSCPLGLVSGSREGIIKLWGPMLQHLRTYDLMEAPVKAIKRNIRALQVGLDPTGTHIRSFLVGTESSEILEISRDTGAMILLVEGHYFDELWGLAPHPTDPNIYITSGDDSTIRMWSLKPHRLLRKCILDCPSRAVTWSPDGEYLAIGLGGSSKGVRQKKDGAFMILESATFKVIYEGRDSRHWIRDIKFSPNGATLALASNDNKIYIYNQDTYSLRCKMDKHSNFVRAIDWSEDSAYIQSDDGDYEHIYSNTFDGSQIRQSSQLKDVKWATWTCLFGWPTQGLWPYVDANQVDPSSVNRSNNEKYIVSGNEAGLVRLFTYPCVSKETEWRQEKAHPYGISSIRWSKDDNYVVSIGAKDRGVHVWKVVETDEPPQEYQDHDNEDPLNE